MNIDETKKIMEITKVAYPEFYKNAELEEKKAALKLWDLMLKNYSYKQCHDAIVCFIAESPYPPKISDVIKRIVPIKAFTSGPEHSEIERMKRLLEQIRNENHESEVTA